MRKRNHFIGVVKKTVITALTAAVLMGTSMEANAAYGGEYYGLGLDWHESDKMEKADGWSNGDMFGNCTWRAENVNFYNGNMQLSITRDPYGNTPYAGGEYRTKEFFGYGMYDVRMKPIKNDGVVSSFFTYTGPVDGNQWDEIDIEFLGKDTTKVQFNYYTNGVGNHEYLYDLGFDASQSFHTYGFLWEKGRITWCVDGKAVYTTTQNIPTTPGKIMMNAWPGVGVDSWLKPFNGNVPLTAEYEWASYTSLDKINSNNNSQNSNNQNNNQDNGQQTTQDNTGLLSGKVYTIRSKQNNKTLDIAYWSNENGANIQLWNYLSQDNQQWILERQSNGYYKIKSKFSNKVLDVSWVSKDNGANIQQWEDVGGAQQLWKIEQVENAYKIINVNSGKALEIAGYSNEDGANIQQWDYYGGDSQLWYFTKIN